MFLADEIDESLSDEDSPPVQPLKKVKYDNITEKSNLYKPPTVQELNELKETQNLYNNNLFRLQIEELISEVKIKQKHRKIFTSWYETFKEKLKLLPELTMSSNMAQQKFGDLIKCDEEFVLRFTKPVKDELFGLETINGLPGPKLVVNINLKIPREFFHAKDYLNNRYFTKRYYYLAYVCFHLKQEHHWSFHCDNTLLPVLELELDKKVLVRIFATPFENYFKALRASPEINNMKSVSDVPTIYYNASFGHDIALSQNHSFIQETLSELLNVQEALKLISVWIQQRALNFILTEDLVLYFIVYLIVKKKINKHMSSYQVVRNFWNFVTESDLSKNGITLCEESKPELLQTFHKHFDVVFLDKSGYYNVVAFLTTNLYEKIKLESGRAFALLDGAVDSFQSLFISKIPTELQYDLILNLRKDETKRVVKKMSDEEQAKYVFYSDLFVVHYVTDYLRRGLNKRAKIIVPIVRDDRISFGINLDPAHAFHILEMGPALNDPKEREFREFWGELSSDRRFKDGSICVAVYFKTETIKEKREIVKTIIDWVVRKKLKLKYRLFYNEFDDLLVNKKIIAPYPLGSNEDGCLRATTTSDELGKKLRELEMPLSITGVQGISNCFTYTEAFPPISCNFGKGSNITTTLENNFLLNTKKFGIIPKYVQPIEGVLQLEHSSKWPKNLTALRHMKTAFYFEISKLLAKKHNIVSTVKTDSIQILYKGYVFNYTLYLSREMGLLKKETTKNGATTYKDTVESRAIELRLNILPKIVGALKGVQSQYPSYGPATALFKRWLRAQLIDNYMFPDDVINLTSASLYVNQSAFDVATTPQIGFLRLLKFFSEFQPHIQTVVVNFNDDISKETLTEIDSRLLKNRDALPNLFIATPFDNCESLFTKSAPSKEVLRRVKQLATETLTHFYQIVNEQISISVKSLFVPNLDGYNAIINLRPLLNPLRHENVIADELQGKIELKEFDPEDSPYIPVTGFNPVQCYLKELRENYGHFANFFHDSYGGNVIGVLWIPKALEPREFKVSSVNGMKLEDDKLVLNVESLIEDFFNLGKYIVKTIDVN